MRARISFALWGPNSRSTHSTGSRLIFLLLQPFLPKHIGSIFWGTVPGLSVALPSGVVIDFSIGLVGFIMKRKKRQERTRMINSFSCIKEEVGLITGLVFNICVAGASEIVKRQERIT